MSATSNPYVTDRPVERPDLFVGRADIFSWLQDSLDVGVRVLAVCGPARVGKSSILAQLPRRLVGNYLPLRVPCRQRAEPDLGRLLFHLAEAVAQDLETRHNLPISPPQEDTFAEDLSALAGPFWAEVRQVTGGRTPILLLDDFEFLAHQADLEVLRGFLDYLQRLLQRDSRLRLIFTALDASRLRALHPDLFTRLLWRNVPPLTRQDALHLVKQPVLGALEYDYDAAERVLELSSRHPAYIQRLCARLVDRLKGQGYVSRAEVDQAAADLVDEGLPEFDALWENLAPEERIVLSALADLRGTRGLPTRQDLVRGLRAAGLAPPTQQLDQVMEQLVEKSALERLGALSYRFSVQLLKTWLRMGHPLEQVLKEEEWPRAEPEPGPSRARQLVLTLAMAVVVGFFGWMTWFQGDAAPEPTPSPTLAATPWVEDTPGASPAPTMTLPRPTPATRTPAPQATLPGQTLPLIPTRGYVLVRSLPAIAYMSRQADAPWQIWVMTSDGENRFPITSAPADNTAPAWSPDGSALLFVSERDGNREIYHIALDDALAGNPPVNLTNSRAEDWTPAWSPDGSEVAFSSNREGNWDIFVMQADGSEPIRLTDDPESDISPAWSPDGQRIAFASKRSGNWDLYVMNRDGSGLTQITDHPASDLSPVWSPDGSRIAFETTRDGDAEIYVMWADGYDKYNLTQDPTANEHWPTWSPDGNHIAFCTNRDKNWEIYTLDVEGYELANLTQSPETNDQGPAWRP